MPTTRLKTFLYRLALPVMAPSVRGRLVFAGDSLNALPALRRVLVRHHVLGGAIRLSRGGITRQADFSVKGMPGHQAAPDTLYRVASITKTATAMVIQILCDRGQLSLDTTIADVLPGGRDCQALAGITVEQLLCHRSGLQDIPAIEAALAHGGTWGELLAAHPEIRFNRDGSVFRYCNFAYGLLGCIIEQVTGLPLSTAYEELLFRPAGMTAVMGGCQAEEERIMEIVRVLPYRKEQAMRITPLGRIPLTEPDPLRHFGHSAGAMYATAGDVHILLDLILSHGVTRDGTRLLSEARIDEMTAVHASYGAASPDTDYGLGLFLLRDEQGAVRFIGHQGYAYGCVDGAFIDRRDDSVIISLNGGADESRKGRVGRINRAILRWAAEKEMAAW